MKRIISCTLLVALLLSCLAGCATTEPATYVVAFHANGGEGTMADLTVEVGTSKALTANSFTREGYDFLGWALGEAASEAAYADKAQVKDLTEAGKTITLYAVWGEKGSAPAETYTVAFDGNGGTGVSTTQTFTVGQEQALDPVCFVQQDYGFLGWALSKDATTPDYTDCQVVKDLAQAGQTVTLYAVWSSDFYTLIFDANGGEGEMMNQRPAVGAAVKLLLNGFAKEGYDFMGWALSADAEEAVYTDGQEVTDLAAVGETVTLYALWGEKQTGDREPEPADPLVVENVNEKGNSDLQSDWIVKVYENSWKDTTASLGLAVGYDRTNAIKFSYWDNTNAYRYSLNYATTGDYDTLILEAKGNGISQVTVQLAGADGVYMSYSLGVVPAVWTRYEISVFDPGWTMNYDGKTAPVGEALEPMGLGSYYDVYKWFNTLHIIFKGSTDNGANGYSFLDNISLEQTKRTESATSTILYDFGYHYTAQLADGTVADLLFNKDKSQVLLTTLNLKDNLRLELYSRVEGNVVFLDGGDQINAIFSLLGNGETLSFSELSGTYASLLQGADFHQVYTVDDYESYGYTGTGADSAIPDIYATSGLRGGYYTEAYTDNADHSTPVGGKKWNWMNNAVNYLDLSGDAHSGSYSMQVVSLQNDNARYITMATVKGGAAAIGKGSTLGLWVKNPTGSPIKIEAVKAIYRDTVSNANIQNNAAFSVSKGVELPANSGWVLVEAELDSSKDVYGFVLVLKANYNGVRELLVDDVMIYSANPNAVYVDPSLRPQMPDKANVFMDFQDLKSGTDYSGEDWKQQVLGATTWGGTSGQMRVRVSTGTNNVLNMYTSKGNAYRYNYVGEGAGLGKATKFSIELGNYFGSAADIQFKIYLIDAEGGVHYLYGADNSYDTLSSTKGPGGEQNLKLFEKTFDEITVQSFYIEIRGTSGDQYVYMDNVTLSYE